MGPRLAATRREFLATFAPATVAAASPPDLPVEYPLFRAGGTPRELGRQHGEQASEYIRRHLDYMQKTQRLSKSRLREKALRFEPLFARYCPHLLEEMKGLAEGAGIEAAEAMAVNIRGELGHVQSSGCTAYVIGAQGTANGELLAGQNSDMANENIRLGYVLHMRPRGKPEVLIWTFGGMIGYHGMNSAGVAQFANALGGGPPGRFAMPHYPVKRMILECARLAQIVELFERIPLASNGNYVLCDGDGAFLDIEATTEGPQLLRGDGAGFLVHTNHFLAPGYATARNLEQSWRDSVPRLERMTALLSGQFGRLSVGHLKTFLSDHSGHPTGICRHDGDSRTVAGIIAEPARGRMHIAAGNPCRGRFVTYSM